MASTYRTQIKAAKSSFELSCIWEDVRNSFWHKKTIDRKMYEKRSAEIIAKREEIARGGKKA